MGGGGRLCQGVQEVSGSKPHPCAESAFSADLKRVSCQAGFCTGNPCRCKLRLTGTVPAASGVSVSMFESRGHLSHVSLKRLLYMSDV